MALPVDSDPHKGPHGWTEYDNDPAVRAAAEAIRAALLPLDAVRIRAALFLADICTDCGYEMGGQGCHCTNDE
jgi:hypothetical protein